MNNPNLYILERLYPVMYKAEYLMFSNRNVKQVGTESKPNNDVPRQAVGTRSATLSLLVVVYLQRRARKTREFIDKLWGNHNKEGVNRISQSEWAGSSYTVCAFHPSSAPLLLRVPLHSTYVLNNSGHNYGFRRTLILVIEVQSRSVTVALFNSSPCDVSTLPLILFYKILAQASGP
ncbi:hypothetical protein J6590_006087 [Homalodisca vitripennis]|nr:hypothetical protein J6590_006087 [Homalodisca vitripennis]